jgi:hypothetical protein
MINDDGICELEFFDDIQPRFVPARFVKLKDYHVNFCGRGYNLATFTVLDDEGVYHEISEAVNWNISESGAIRRLQNENFPIFKNN